MFDYEINAAKIGVDKLDNCPWVVNPPQDCDANSATSVEQCDADADGIGDACDSGTCSMATLPATCSGGYRNRATCTRNIDCAFPTTDIATAGQSDGTVRILLGDQSGFLREAASIPGLTRPSGLAVAPVSLTWARPFS